MSERRITEAGSGASKVARDLVASARTDAPSAAARARARNQFERALGSEGVTTHISALSEALAESKLSIPNLAQVAAPLSHAPVPTSNRASSTVTFAAFFAAACIVGGGAFLSMKLFQRPTVANGSATELPAFHAGNAATNTNATHADSGPSIAAATAGTTSVAATGSTGTAGTPIAMTPDAGAAILVASASGGSASGSTHTPEHVGAHAGGATAHASSSGGGGGGGGGGSVASSSHAGNGSSCTARCHGDINCLLNCGTLPSSSGGSGGGAGSGSSASGGGGGASSTNTPPMPSRPDVISAMNSVRNAVQSCGRGMTGQAAVSITFGSNGHVQTASVSSGPFVGTTNGSCIERAARRATVPPFSRTTFTINYPFVVH